MISRTKEFEYALEHAQSVNDIYRILEKHVIPTFPFLDFTLHVKRDNQLDLTAKLLKDLLSNQLEGQALLDYLQQLIITTKNKNAIKGINPQPEDLFKTWPWSQALRDADRIIAPWLFTDKLKFLARFDPDNFYENALKLVEHTRKTLFND